MSFKVTRIDLEDGAGAKDSLRGLVLYPDEVEDYLFRRDYGNRPNRFQLPALHAEDLEVTRFDRDMLALSGYIAMKHEPTGEVVHVHFGVGHVWRSELQARARAVELLQLLIAKRTYGAKGWDE